MRSSRPDRRRLRRASLALAVVGFAAVTWLPARAPATVAEQRARLPPAAECDEEIIAGVWRSHRYDVQYSEWSVFTLYIERVEAAPTQLTGRITARFWHGGPEDEEPPPCERQDRFDVTVSFDGRGSVDPQQRILFGGVGQWRLDETRCGRMPGGYNLDQFTGVVDPAILEFQSVNNDGGRAVNVPIVFRRVRCPPPRSASAPTVQTRRPSFYPDSGGCGIF